MLNKLIALDKVVILPYEITIPKQVRGTGYAFGGQLIDLDIPVTGQDEKERLTSLALSLARFSNMMGETTIYLDLPAATLAKLKTLYVTDKQAATIHQQQIGVRADGAMELRTLDMQPADMAADTVHQRPLAPSLIHPQATHSLIAAFGATHFRISIIDDAGVEKTAIKINSKLTTLLKENKLDKVLDDLHVKNKVDLMDIIQKMLNNNLRGIDQYTGVTPDEIKKIEKLQLMRIDAAIEQLTTDAQLDNTSIKGLAFTIAGSINMTEGIIHSDGVEGFRQTNIAEHYETRLNMPVIPMNDVDCEIAALAKRAVDLDNMARRDRVELVDLNPADAALYRLAKNIQPRQSVRITGIGGGTGAGGSQLDLYRDAQGDLRLKLLLGRYASVAELGHNAFNLQIPEYRQAIISFWNENDLPDFAAKTELKFSNIYDFSTQFLNQQEKSVCKWCGNHLDFEKLAAGVALDNISPWLYALLNEQDKQTLQAIIRKNHSSVTAWPDSAYEKNMNAGDFIRFYQQTQNIYAEMILKVMAKIWAANFVLLAHDAQSIRINGQADTWKTFFVTQGMFRDGNGFFQTWIEQSLQNDFGDAGRQLSVIFAHDDKNQANGAVALLGSQIASVMEPK